MVITIFSYSITHDEITFYQKAISSYYKYDFLNLLAHKNEYGYGGAWFTLYTLMIYISEFLTNLDFSILLKTDSTSMGIYLENIGYMLPLIFMKLINILSLNIVFYILLKHYNNNLDFSIFAIFFFLITPMFYWSGKFASPDILSASLIFISVYMYFYKSRVFLAVLLITISLAIKLSALPVLVALFLYELIFNFFELKNKRFIPLLQYSLIVYVGFIVLNLYIITNFPDFIDTLIFYVNNHSNHITSYSQFISSINHRLFSLEGTAWDLVFFGSLSYFSTNAYLIIGFLFLSLFFSKKLSINIFFILTFIFSLLVIIRQSTYGWNWFPYILLFPLLFLNLKNNKFTKLFIFSFLILSLFYSFQNVRKEIVNKYIQISNLATFKNNKSSIEQCIEDAIESNDFLVKRKLNFSDIQISIFGFQSFLYSKWRVNDKYQSGDVVLVGNRTSLILPRLEFKIKKYKYQSKKCSFINVYLIGE